MSFRRELAPRWDLSLPGAAARESRVGEGWLSRGGEGWLFWERKVLEGKELGLDWRRAAAAGTGRGRETIGWEGGGTCQNVGASVVCRGCLRVQGELPHRLVGNQRL